MSEDLKLLKALSKGASSIESSPNNEKEEEDGFASAIAGIFDNLDGDDSVLPDLPRGAVFEDTTLHSGGAKLKVGLVYWMVNFY